MGLNELTIVQAHEGLKKKKFSSKELVKACIDCIHEVENDISAFITVMEKQALKQAQAVDKKIAAGVIPGMLEGIPLAIKDTILVKDTKCTAGSKILENYTAVYDATAVRKLKRAGAVILGKTNCDEFAMGTSGENSSFKITKNPHDLKRVPGGSSAGSAAAVAANECLAALGSDTGGSIRQPAGLCGVVGMKPTYGAVSRYGLIALASGFDVIGPVAKTVEDAKIVFDAIKGKDAMDSTTVELENEKQKTGFKGLKIGVPKEYFIDGMDHDTEKSVRGAISQLEKLGAKLVEVSLPYTSYTLAAYYILQPAEASANLARYDGIRYGHSEQKAKDLLEVYTKSRAKGFGDEVKRRIMIGTYVLSSGYVDAYYKKAQAVRALVKKDFDKVFSKVDCLATPTSPYSAWLIGEKIQDPLSMYLADIYTVSANIAGLPGISVPCGKAHNLPVGLQILAPQLGEETMFKVAGAYESSL